MPTDATASYVIAVDAGGTHTRVGCFGLDGTVLSVARGRGGSPNHNHDAAETVAATLDAALTTAGVDPGDAVALVAGMAAISRRGSNQGAGDNDWADGYFRRPGLHCPRAVVNDAVIAHRGALAGRPGVIVVAGTGSMILAITEDGTEVESGQFEHYAGAARHLVFDVMHRVLDGSADAGDVLVREVMDYWQAVDLAQLRRILLGLDGVDRNDVKRRYGGLAPAVTAAADRSPLADAALCRLAAKTAEGVLVLAPLIAERPVAVSVTGGLAGDPAFRSRLARALDVAGSTPTALVDPVLDPLGGAAMLAYDLAGVVPDGRLLDRVGMATTA